MHATWVLELRAIITRCFDSQSFLKSSVPELDFFSKCFSVVLSIFHHFPKHFAHIFLRLAL